MIDAIAKDLLDMGLVDTPEEARRYAHKVLDLFFLAEARELTPKQLRCKLRRLFAKKDRGEYGYGGDWWKKGDKEPNG